MQRHRFLFLALGLLTVWRLALLPTQNLSPDEAFISLQVSQPWAADFSLHGPLPIWLGKISTRLGGPQAFGLRLFAPLLAFVTSWLAWRLARGVFDTSVAGWTVVILNLLPGFNIAAVTWTPSILLYASLTGLAFCLRVAVLHTARRHWSWAAGGGCLAAAFLASPGALIGIAAAGAALALPRRRRHHLQSEGFLILSGVLAPFLVLWFVWQQQHGWPLLESGDWKPNLYLIPGWFRWIVLASPLMLTAIFWAVKNALWRAPDRSSHSMVLGYAIPLAIADLLWGADDRWPDMGGSVWMVFGAMLAAHQAVVSTLVPSEDRISWRTVALGLAAIQSVFLVNSDFVRAIGIPWSFQQRVATAGSPYIRLFTSDPSAVMRGWDRTAGFLSDVLLETQLQPEASARSFVIASSWQLAAALNAALPPHTPCLRPTPHHPYVHAAQEPSDFSHPFAFLPRYDERDEHGNSAFAGRDALYVTDNAESNAPPPRIRHAFSHSRLLSVAQVIHGGQQVREVRIFACYDYQPPQF